MDTRSYKTRSAKASDIEARWYVIDAEGQTLGRMSSRIARVLIGKHKPEYTPHVDCGDHVIVVNAENIRLTGNKMEDKKYKRYSGYPGGQKETSARELLAKQPTALVENAVRNMLPKSRLGRAMFRKLYVYAGPDHPHEAQKPEDFKF